MDDICEFRVVSATSEDGNHISSNITVADLSEMWQTKAGAEKASIVLELDNPIVLHTIEIGLYLPYLGQM